MNVPTYIYSFFEKQNTHTDLTGPTFLVIFRIIFFSYKNFQNITAKFYRKYVIKTKILRHFTSIEIQKKPLKIEIAWRR